jgi:phosphoribosylanthranilate isomerase
MTWIKICGITNLEDAHAAVDAGADALGFVFYEKSPRRVIPKRVRQIVKELPDHIEKIGVFVMAPEAEIEFVAEEAGLTGWQLYKDLSGTPLETALRDGGFFCLRKHKSASGRKIYIALPADVLIDEEGYRGFGWSNGANADIGALFIDSGSGKKPGGTGKAFNWHELANAVQGLALNFKVVVAGGLSPTNVTEAMHILHPWGVDVSSGVEARPGKKDPEKIRAFIRAVREADKANSN